MAPYKIPFTKEGYERFKKEYDNLQQQRPTVVQELSTARDMGDRSENAAYKEARRKLSSTDSRLRFLKRILEHAKVVTPLQSEFVEIGSSVTVHNGTQDITFYIVGEYEADPIEKRLSYKSPVGRALLHKRVGDRCVVQIPSGEISYFIQEISI